MRTPVDSDAVGADGGRRVDGVNSATPRGQHAPRSYLPPHGTSHSPADGAGAGAGAAVGAGAGVGAGTPPEPRAAPAATAPPAAAPQASHATPGGQGRRSSVGKDHKAPKIGSVRKKLPADFMGAGRSPSTGNVRTKAKAKPTPPAQRTPLQSPARDSAAAGWGRDGSDASPGFGGVVDGGDGYGADSFEDDMVSPRGPPLSHRSGYAGARVTDITDAVGGSSDDAGVPADAAAPSASPQPETSASTPPQPDDSAVPVAEAPAAIGGDTMDDGTTGAAVSAAPASDVAAEAPATSVSAASAENGADAAAAAPSVVAEVGADTRGVDARGDAPGDGAVASSAGAADHNVDDDGGDDDNYSDDYDEDVN